MTSLDRLFPGGQRRLNPQSSPTATPPSVELSPRRVATALPTAHTRPVVNGSPCAHQLSVPNDTVVSSVVDDDAVAVKSFPPNPLLAGLGRARRGPRDRCVFTPCKCARAPLRRYPRSPSNLDRPVPGLARLRTHGRTDAKRAHHSGHIQALSIAGTIPPANIFTPVVYILVVPS